jgi:hypothetical protein
MKRHRKLRGSLAHVEGSQKSLLIITLIIVPVAVILQGMWVSKNRELFVGSLMTHIQTERVTCEECGGTGYVRPDEAEDTLVLCPVCFGVGAHHIRKTNKGEALCPACVGMGRIREGDTAEARWCRRCAGRGVIQLGAPEPYAATNSLAAQE